MTFYLGYLLFVCVLLRLTTSAVTSTPSPTARILGLLLLLLLLVNFLNGVFRRVSTLQLQL